MHGPEFLCHVATSLTSLQVTIGEHLAIYSAFLRVFNESARNISVMIGSFSRPWSAGLTPGKSPFYKIAHISIIPFPASPFHDNFHQVNLANQIMSLLNDFSCLFPGNSTESSSSSEIWMLRILSGYDSLFHGGDNRCWSEQRNLKTPCCQSRNADRSKRLLALSKI
jgi:hypothetical protein